MTGEDVAAVRKMALLLLVGLKLTDEIKMRIPIKIYATFEL